MTFVDTNVIIDVLFDDPKWSDWSLEKLAEATVDVAATINIVVVAELSRNFRTVEELRSRLDAASLSVAPIEDDAAFLAGHVFARYRRARQGSLSKVLPDFMIGAHAVTLGLPLLTRDPRFFRAYFPELPLLTPDTDNG